jgi:hypothetical protein
MYRERLKAIFRGLLSPGKFQIEELSIVHLLRHQATVNDGFICRPSQPEVAVNGGDTLSDAVESLSLEQKAQGGNISKAQAKRLRKKIREGRTDL